MSGNGKKPEVTKIKKSVLTPFGYGYYEIVQPSQPSQPPPSPVKKPEMGKSENNPSGEAKVEEIKKEEKKSAPEAKEEKKNPAEIPSTAPEKKPAEVSNNQIQDESSIIETVKLRSGGVAYLPRGSLQTKIALKLKTFFGARKTHVIEMEITETVDKLKQKLIQADAEKELVGCKQIRLIYPIGKIRDLPPSQTIEYLDIPNNATIIALGMKTFCWDTSMKGNDIELQNGNTTANKKQIQDHELVLGSIGFLTGRHYWEITIDAMVESEDVHVGIAQKEVNLYSKPVEGMPFWGYVCGAARKVGQKAEDESATAYGEVCAAGDNIGVLLEFTETEGQVSFYRNKKCLGVAYSGLPLATYYPAACLYYSSVRVTLVSNVPVPVASSKSG